MCEFLKSFLRDETGAITADWVFLTAGVVALGLNAVSVVDDGTTELGSKVETTVTVSNGD